MNSKIETILYAVKIDNEDWQEEIITTNANVIDKATKWAAENGYDRFRISQFDPQEKPTFGNKIRLIADRKR